MEIKKRTVKTFDEFSSCIKEFEQNSNRCNHSFDMMAFYRGHSNEEYVCQPTVFRNILGREDNMLKREDEIVKLCRRGFSCEFSHLKSDFDMLAQLQHYGAATRILDFTISPEVALYFACCDCFRGSTHNGEVIFYYTTYTSQENIGVKALSFLAQQPYRLEVDFYQKLREYLGVNYSDDKLRSIIEQHYFVIPTISNERLRRQKGVFAIFGQKIEKLPCDKQTTNLSDKYGRGQEYPGDIYRIQIPADAKKKIMEKLLKKIEDRQIRNLSNTENMKTIKSFFFPNMENEFGEISYFGDLRRDVPLGASEFNKVCFETENMCELKKIGKEVDINLKAIVGKGDQYIVVSSEEEKKVMIYTQLGEAKSERLSEIFDDIAQNDANVIIWLAPKVNEDTKFTVQWINKHSQGLKFYLMKFERSNALITYQKIL